MNCGNYEIAAILILFLRLFLDRFFKFFWHQAYAHYVDKDVFAVRRAVIPIKVNI